MKKKLFIVWIIFIGILTACELSNNPTSKVEELLSKYQMYDQEISTSTSYLELTDGTPLDNNLQERYEKLIKKQYKNLSYEVKEEKIDGNNAVITVQIEVMDYLSVFQKYDQNNYEESDYYEKIVDDLEEVKDKVTYTIDFNVIKDQKGNWKVSELGQEENAKLLGMYS